jgi:hypothetical protein
VGHGLQVEPVQLQHAEPGGGDGRHGVAVGVAAADQPPPGALEPVLPAGQPRVVGSHVLVEAQPPARAQHPANLGQGPVRVGDGAQHQAGHHRVDGAVGGGQRLGDPVGHPDRHRRLAGRGQGLAAQVGLWLDGPDLGDGGRVVGEVEAVAGADLQDPAREAGQQPSSVVADLGVHEVADPGIDAGEEGMVNWSLLGKCAHGHPFELRVMGTS